MDLAMIGKSFFSALMLVTSTVSVSKISDDYILVNLVGFAVDDSSMVTKTEVIKRWLVSKDAFGKSGKLLCQPFMGRHLNINKTRAAHRNKIMGDLENFKIVTSGAELDKNSIAIKQVEELVVSKLSNIEKYKYMVECHTLSPNSEMSDFFDF